MSLPVQLAAVAHRTVTGLRTIVTAVIRRHGFALTKAAFDFILGRLASPAAWAEYAYIRDHADRLIEHGMGKGRHRQARLRRA